MSKTIRTTCKSMIKFTDYDALGFDMDFTLARYKLVPFFEHAYGCITKFLVEKKKYDSTIFHGILEDKDLVYSGLIADVEKGNVLKVGENGSIIRASHGTRLLTNEEITDIYGVQKLFPFYEEFINGEKSIDKKWRFFENFFDIPGLVAFSKIVDHMEEQECKPESKSFLQIFFDITEAFEDMYVPSQFAKGRGHYFPTIKAYPGNYIDQISEEVKTWLKKLRQDGRKLFLLTSSYPDYSDLIMKNMLGDEWKKYFDICLYGARKPKFFQESKPFIRMSNGLPMEEVSQLEAGKDYCHGNYDDLTLFLKKITGKENPKVIYFGDNLFADAWPSTLLAGWDSVLILEEMDAEGYAVTDGTVPGHDDELEDPSVEPAKRKHNYEHSSLVTKEEIGLMVSSFWGSPFIDKTGDSSSNNTDMNMKTMNTCYGHLISKYATICVPSIEYLSGVPVDHEFTTFSAEPGNARGFHPGRPRSLLPMQ